MMRRRYILYPILLIFASGCAAMIGGGRDCSSPAAALLGEWKMLDGSGEVSFTSDGNYHFIDPTGSPGRAEYVVLTEDEEKRTIVTQVRLKEFEGEPVEEEVELKIEGRFSPNYQVFVGAMVDEDGLATGEFRMSR